MTRLKYKLSISLSESSVVNKKILPCLSLFNLDLDFSLLGPIYQLLVQCLIRPIQHAAQILLRHIQLVASIIVLRTSLHVA